MGLTGFYIIGDKNWSIVDSIYVTIIPISTVDTLLGKVIVIGSALALLFAHPILGALGVIAAYRLITQSEERALPPAPVSPPKKHVKTRHLTAMNQFPVTVEEEVIRKMIPQAPSNLPPAGYKPTLDTLHDAARIN